MLGVKGDANALVASKEGLLVVIFAAPDDAAVDFVRAASRAGARRPTEQDTGRGDAGAPSAVQLRRPSTVGRWQITLGRARPGAAGVFASYEEAVDARELAARLRLDQPVVAVERPAGLPDAAARPRRPSPTWSARRCGR